MPKRNWPEEIEEAIRQAISNVPGLKTIPESEYVQYTLEALAGVSCGLEMRKQELGD